MKTGLLIRARHLFHCGDSRIDRHNIRRWVRSVRFLGDKWLLVKPVEKKK